MNKYRISFHSNSGTIFRTIAEEKSLKLVKKHIQKALKEDLGPFAMEGKDNRYFDVETSNVTFIEYELLLSGKNIHFKTLANLNLTVLSKITSEVDDATLARAIFNVSSKEKDTFSYAVDIKRWEGIQKLMEQWNQVKEEEILEAQQKVVRVASRLAEDDVIDIA